MTRMNGFLRAAIGGALTLALAGTSMNVAWAAGPFASFAGNWKGSGTITVDNGSKERLRCKAHYDIGDGGNSLAQNLTCASDSYKFNVVSDVRAEGGAISGSWSETSRGANGRITGTIGPTQISANAAGLGFTARIGIAARGGRQSVTISPTGTDISNVLVTMSKI